jgi:O-acetyl-ADP-ribose deacetylase (regulator of RNase III)
MEVVGSEMLFSAQTVDGMVHLMGGAALRRELEVLGGCPVGHAVTTAAAATPYHAIVHTSTPNVSYQHQRRQYRPAGDPDATPSSSNDFDPEDEAQLLLAQCYSSALQQAASTSMPHSRYQTHILLATPLLGAGCRGFPIDIACTVAARAAIAWYNDPSTVPVAATQPPSPHSSISITLAFGLLEEATAEQLVREIQNANMKE